MKTFLVSAGLALVVTVASVPAQAGLPFWQR